MTADEYSVLALRTEADQQRILDRLNQLGAQAMRLDNGARGLANDAGEVASTVMKYIEYGQPLNVLNLKEEVGDCLWRLNQICAAAGFTLQEAMEGNVRKLAIRYPHKYSDELAAEKNRKRASEANAVLGASYNKEAD